jgi:transcriptional regulator with XRE-family HTH domain
MAYRSKAPKRFMKKLGVTLDDFIALKGWTQERAARELGVTRAGLFNFLKGKDAPRSDFLVRAFQKLGMVFEYQGWVLSAEQKVGKSAPLEQLSLFEDIQNKNLLVSVLKKSPKSLDLQVRIKIPV